jgi:hypothetical protein
LIRSYLSSFQLRPLVDMNLLADSKLPQQVKMDKRREEGIRDDGGDDEVVVVVVVEERGDGGIARWRKTERNCRF